MAFELFEQKQSYVHHSKVLVDGINASNSQWCGCIFLMCYTNLKLALLLHKTVLLNYPIGTTVYSGIPYGDLIVI